MLKRFVQSIRSTYTAHTGEILAAVATLIWAACVGGFTLESGFGRVADFAFAFGVALIGVPFSALVFAGILALLGQLPWLYAGFLLAAGLFVTLLWMEWEGAVLAALLLLVECLLGGSLARILSGGLRQASWFKRVATWSILALTLGANVFFFGFVRRDGIDEELIQVKQNAASLPAALDDPDPSQPGPYKVKTLYYGSGDGLRRPEFGSSVAIRTASVNASKFLKGFDGWKAWIRKQYWGFGMDKLPLNAEVFYPDGVGPFPLFLIVHGNHQMSVASDKGYAYLGELLASHGFIVASVDENFLNSGLFHDPPKQQAVRGWLLLEHLRVWHEWMKDTRNPLYGKADLTRIALGGHSRGGEAAATAALFNRLEYYPDDATIQFDYGYAIKSVVAIAPPDGQYKPAEQFRILKDVNYLTLQGANDSDVSSFEGSRQYEHVRFTGAVPAFKAELYIYRANHGQFNTMWGRTDSGAPQSWFLNLRPLLTGDAQRQISKVYISAFLEATLNGRKEYEAMFRDYRVARKWLPDTLYVNRFSDQTYKDICSFDEDTDVTTTTAEGGHISSSGLTLWREGKIPFRQGSRDYNGVFLGWNWKRQKTAPANAPNYAIDLPAGMEGEALTLSAAATDTNAPEPGKKTDEESEENDEPTDFTIEAVSANGATARVAAGDFMLLLPPLHVQFTKIEKLDNREYSEAAEPVFQTIRIPFSAFVKANPAFNAKEVRRVRLVFNRTPARVIIISGIGLEGG